MEVEGRALGGKAVTGHCVVWMDDKPCTTHCRQLTPTARGDLPTCDPLCDPLMSTISCLLTVVEGPWLARQHR